MHRLIHQPTIEKVGAALNLLPIGWRNLVEDVDVVTGLDPAFIGLHYIRDIFDGRSYSNTAHTVHPYNQEHMVRAKRSTTIVLFECDSVDDIVHELGHVLYYRLNWRWMPGPCTQYAMTNYHEQFAEAICAWCVDGYPTIRWNRIDTELMWWIELNNP